MKELFYYYSEDAEKKAKEIAAEIDGTIENQSCEKIYDCEPMDKKAEAIINNSVSGDTGAFWVYDKDYNLAAIVAHWISRDANLNISIEDFADGVNEQTFFPHLFEPDIDDPEDSEETWRKVHPHMGVTVFPHLFEPDIDDPEDSEETWRKVHPHILT